MAHYPSLVPWGTIVLGLARQEGARSPKAQVSPDSKIHLRNFGAEGHSVMQRRGLRGPMLFLSDVELCHCGLNCRKGALTAELR